MEDQSITIKKKKKKQTKKNLPRNVFEIVGDQGKVVERVEPKVSAKKPKEPSEAKPTYSERTKKRRRRDWDAMNYEPFDITRGRDYERSLQKIATRGIVQLFNTVRKQQQQQSASTGKKEKKQNGINKGEFLDMLKNIDSDETSYKILKKNASTEESMGTTKKPAKWNVLQDDLMASVKDDEDESDEEEAEEED